ncbi:hypothetical protein NBRC116601_31200 [Cognatishimia sp. WU-CL00825]
MLDQLRSGDVVLVSKYDRLARSLVELLDIVAQIETNKAGFRSLAEDIDTTTPAGRLIFHVFASIAQFERERIRQRTMEGLQAARAKGRIGGRPCALSEDQKTEGRSRDKRHRRLAQSQPGYGETSVAKHLRSYETELPGDFWGRIEASSL